MGRKKVTLLIDQDDVLAEYIAGVIENFNKKYSTKFTVEDCRSWDLHAIFGKEIETIMHEPELFRSLRPTRYALEVFERLYKSGLFDIYIVTAANPRAVEAKYEWIKRYLPFLPQNRIIVCSSKFMIKGDYLLDDGMHNIEDFAQAGGKPIVFERPHNVGIGHEFMRVRDWLSFERLIINECYPEMVEEYFGQQGQEEAI